MATQNNTQRKKTNTSGSGKGTGRAGGGKNPAGTADRRTTGGRTAARGSAAQRGSGRNGGGRKDDRGSDKWMNIFLVLLVITVIVLAVLYFRKDADEPENPVPTQQVQPGGVTPGAGDVTGEPTAEPTVPDEPTQTPTATPVMTPADTPQPTKEPEPTEAVSPTPQATVPAEQGIGTAQADEILADVFWEVGYRFTLSDSDFTLDGETYYRYDASYQGEAQSYDVLVRRDDGELYYYENGTKRDFDGLPEHTKQPEEAVSGTMTADAAAELLRQFSHTSLGLPAPLDECSLMLDNWKTVVYGEECYCLNVFYDGALAGNLYFTEDAAKVYYLDEFGEFVAVR